MGADIVIAVTLQDITDENKDPDTIISIADRSIDIMIKDLTRLSLEDADIIFKPGYIGEISFFMKEKERIKVIKAGEEEAIKKIPELKKIIADF